MRTTLCMMLALVLGAPVAFTGCDRYEHESTKTTTDPNGNTVQEKKSVVTDGNGNVQEKKQTTVTNNP